MDDSSGLAWSPALQVAALLLTGACVATWLLVALRLRRGAPVLPYQVRRPVPWRAPTVLAVLVVFYLAPVLIGPLVGVSPGRVTAKSTATQSRQQPDTRHAIEDVLRADRSAGTWLLCGVVAVVVAPVVEEFLYRLLLLGWLEAEERRARRRIAILRSLIPGVGPVVLVSLLFALSHFRRAGPPVEPDVLKQLIVFQAVWGVLTLVFMLWAVRRLSGASLADLGFVRERFFADVRLGLLACAAVFAPIMLLQYVTTLFVVPEDVAADPIPLFLLALLLGTVYYRTHRIVPAIVIHMAFNGTSLALAWLQP
jgi:membrane protease YdiL (CAAX protease family)